jgi:hypothetical protein
MLNDFWHTYETFGTMVGFPVGCGTTSRTQSATDPLRVSSEVGYIGGLPNPHLVKPCGGKDIAIKRCSQAASAIAA